MLKQMKELLSLREADELDLDDLNLDTGLDDADPADEDPEAKKDDKAADKDKKDDKKEKPETVVLTKDALEVLLDLHRDGTEVDAEALLDAMLEQGYLDGDQVRDLLSADDSESEDSKKDDKKEDEKKESDSTEDELKDE